MPHACFEKPKDAHDKYDENGHSKYTYYSGNVFHKQFSSNLSFCDIRLISPFQGLLFVRSATQGVALLGWYIVPFQGYNCRKQIAGLQAGYEPGTCSQRSEQVHFRLNRVS
jgi:hypothetical protein